MLRNLRNALLFLCLSTQANAISLLHPVAHIGGSYTVHNISYHLTNKLFNNKSLAYLVSIPLTIGIGIGYKYLEDGSLKHMRTDQVLYNTTGLALSIIVIKLDE